MATFTDSQRQDAELLQALAALANATDLSSLSLYLADYNWKLIKTMTSSGGTVQAYLAKGPLPSSGQDVAALAVGTPWQKFLGWYKSYSHQLNPLPASLTSNKPPTVQAALVREVESSSAIAGLSAKVPQLQAYSYETLSRLPHLVAEQLKQCHQAVAAIQTGISSDRERLQTLTPSNPAEMPSLLVALEAKSNAVLAKIEELIQTLAQIADKFSQPGSFQANEKKTSASKSLFERYYSLLAEVRATSQNYDQDLYQLENPTVRASSNQEIPQFDFGYLTLYGSIQKLIWQNLSLVQTQGIYVTGHTQASPIAQLAALDLGMKKSSPTLLGSYTFSTPAMGNQEFVNFYQQNIPNSFSVVAQGVDFFPTSPTATEGYYLAGQQVAMEAKIPQYDAPWFERSEVFYQQLFAPGRTARLQEAGASSRTVDAESDRFSAGYALAVSLASATTDPPSGYDRNLAYTLAILSSIAYQRFQQPNLPDSTPSPWQISSDFYSGNTVFGTIFQSQNQVAIVFRGTVSWQELIEILGDSFFTWPDFLPEDADQISEGIGTAYSNIRQSLFDKLKAVTNLNQKQLVITGHSVGGALATLCALDLSGLQPGIRAPSAVYTFGSPPVGTYAFANYFNKIVGNKSYRVVRAWDIIPKLIFAGYWQVDGQATLQGNTQEDDYTCHPINTYIQLLNPRA